MSRIGRIIVLRVSVELWPGPSDTSKHGKDFSLLGSPRVSTCPVSRHDGPPRPVRIHGGRTAVETGRVRFQPQGRGPRGPTPYLGNLILLRSGGGPEEPTCTLVSSSSPDADDRPRQECTGGREVSRRRGRGRLEEAPESGEVAATGTLQECLQGRSPPISPSPEVSRTPGQTSNNPKPPHLLSLSFGVRSLPVDHRVSVD